jgi:hypothetical protein
MNNNSITGIAVTSFKTFMVHMLKLSVIIFTWGLQFLGQALTILATTVQKIILRKS